MSLSIVSEELPTHSRSLVIYSSDMDIIINIGNMEYFNRSEVSFGEIDISEILAMTPDLDLDSFTDMDISITSNDTTNTETEIDSIDVTNTEIGMDSNDETNMETLIDLNNVRNMENLFNPLNELNFTNIDLSFINLMHLLFNGYISENDEEEENIYLQYELPAAVIELLQSLRNAPQPRPVPDNVVNNLPIIKMDANLLAKNEQCPICLDHFKLEEEVMLLPCNHSYHESCVRSWFEQQNHCPFCRQEV